MSGEGTLSGVRPDPSHSVHADPAVRLAVAASPDTPPATLQHLALHDADDHVRCAALSRILPLESHLAWQVLDEGPSIPARMVLGRWRFTAADAHRVPAAPDWVRTALACDDSAPDWLVGDLATRDRSPHVRRRAVANPGAPARVLAQALSDPDPDVRATAVRHPNFPTLSLPRAVADAAIRVRRVAASRPDLGEELLAILADDDAVSVRVAVLKRTDCPSDFLDRAVHSPLPAVRSAAVRHPQCPCSALAVASQDCDDVIRLHALEHPNGLPATVAWDVLQECASRRPGRPPVPPDMREALRRAALDSLRRSSWPDLEPLALERLGPDDLAAIIAAHTAAAALDRRSPVRLAAAAHERTAAVDLIRIGADADPQVRETASSRVLAMVSTTPEPA